MGPANSRGVSDRLYPQSIPVKPTWPNSPASRKARTGNSGGTGTHTKRGNTRVLPIQQELCLPNIPGRKEGRGTTPSNKPESPEPIRASRALQDGGLTPPTRPATARGLDDKNGPKGRLSPNPNTPEAPVLPPLCVGGKTLQVSKPPIWPLLGTTGIYQNTKTSGGLAETDRPAPDSISRPHAIYACQQRPAGEDGTSSMQTVRVPGTDGKHQKIPVNPSSTDRVPGISDRLQLDDNQSAIKEGQEDSTGGSETPKDANNLSTGTCHVYWESSGNFQGHHPGPPTLQSLTDGTQLSDPREQHSRGLGQIRLQDTLEQ